MPPLPRHRSRCVRAAAGAGSESALRWRARIRRGAFPRSRRGRRHRRGPRARRPAFHWRRRRRHRPRARRLRPASCAACALSSSAVSRSRAAMACSISRLQRFGLCGGDRALFLDLLAPARDIGQPPRRIARPRIPAAHVGAHRIDPLTPDGDRLLQRGMFGHRLLQLRARGVVAAARRFARLPLGGRIGQGVALGGGIGQLVLRCGDAARQFLHPLGQFGAGAQQPVQRGFGLTPRHQGGAFLVRCRGHRAFRLGIRLARLHRKPRWRRSALPRRGPAASRRAGSRAASASSRFAASSRAASAAPSPRTTKPSQRRRAPAFVTSHSPGASACAAVLVRHTHQRQPRLQFGRAHR